MFQTCLKCGYKTILHAWDQLDWCPDCGERLYIYTPKRMEKDDSKIPPGLYCYDEHGICPYWEKFSGLSDQESGFCHYLNLGDWMENGTVLLWDQCKECGTNDGG